MNLALGRGAMLCTPCAAPTRVPYGEAPDRFLRVSMSNSELGEAVSHSRTWHFPVLLLPAAQLGAGSTLPALQQLGATSGMGLCFAISLLCSGCSSLLLTQIADLSLGNGVSCASSNSCTPKAFPSPTIVLFSVQLCWLCSRLVQQHLPVLSPIPQSPPEPLSTSIQEGAKPNARSWSWVTWQGKSARWTPAGSSG